MNQETLVNDSDILIQKSKFFIYRAFTYFFFLLFPIWTPKSVQMEPWAQCFVMVLYVGFMVAQWFLMGKEVDHRLKIYFKANSSLDRVVYRLLLGMSVMMVYFNILSLLSPKWIYNVFWFTWVVLGLFYSWPTRGKIIQESVSTNFKEFRYLDGFEKTVLFLIFVFFIFSFPELPNLKTVEGLKLVFDPRDIASPHFWNFLTVNFYPFKKYPDLFRIGWAMHYYLIGIGTTLVALYAVLRYFVSRRLSLLGVFAFLSSWSISKTLDHSIGESLLSTFPIWWAWSVLWATKSATYRCGLFIGMISFIGTLLSPSYFYLFPLSLSLMFFIFLKEKTFWYKRQIAKYSLVGMIFSLLVVLPNIPAFDGYLFQSEKEFFGEIFRLFERKAFYSLGVFGLVLAGLSILAPSSGVVRRFKIESGDLKEFLYVFLVLTLSGLIFEISSFYSFSVMWILVLFSLLPVELLFQTISRLRSKRNFIYVIYILVCLLDSHFEGRVKIFLRLFDL